MNKDEMKMIEKMASIICKETWNKGLCEKCDFKKHEQFGYTYQCRKFDDAEALYNAGCRIIGEDSVVMSREEFDENYVTRDDYNYIKYKYDALVARVKNNKQETAKEILQELKNKQIYMLENDLFGKDTAYIQAINQLAIKYDIELED